MLNWLFALTSALLLILTFPNWNVWWLAPAAMCPMLVAVAREPRPFRRFLMGWSAGIVYWFGVCYWIQIVLAVHGNMGDFEAWALFSLFCLAKGLHMAVFALLAGILMRRWWAVPCVAALWVAIEATHGALGFAWLTLGNAGVGMSLPMRLAPITGVYGISFLFMLMSGALAIAALRRPSRELAWLAPVLLLAVLPALPGPNRGTDTAVLLQPNISETDDWTPAGVNELQQRLVELSLRGVLSQVGKPPSIIVWPEVPAPLYYYEDPRFRQYLDTLAREIHSYLLVGIVAHSPGGAPLNSAVLVNSNGIATTRYDKVNLVPFGEFVPWPFDSIANKVSTEVGDFEAGKRVVVSPVDNHRIGTFICYESVFPNFVRKFAANGAEVLFNISNDGWFGKSAAREQHLEIVRMRAAENRRWILRSTNDGITATIDAAGRLRGTLPTYTEGTSYTGFEYIKSKTIYTRFGDWFPFLCATIALMGLIAEKIL